jgi:very-short-patch-repair endonuclease
LPLQRPIELAALEDALADGGTFLLEASVRPHGSRAQAGWSETAATPRPTDDGEDDGGSDSDVAPRDGAGGRPAHDDEDSNEDPVERIAAQLRDDLRANVIHAGIAGDDLVRRLVEIARAARTAVEESGASTLFLALGMLRWYESDVSREPRSAPLLLLPLEIERPNPRGGFTIRLADDEARANESLIAKLQTEFGITVRGPDGGVLDELPSDDRGVDVSAVLQAFRVAVRDFDRWEVVEEAWIGLFSFTKFLMWNDLSRGVEALLGNPLLGRLVFQGDGERDALAPEDEEEPPAERLDDVPPEELLCPLDADSSQLCAIVAATGTEPRGAMPAVRPRSFVLEGPPGTGKSQTITNLIAHALGLGRTVLFVAEKRAALEVVQRRLAQVGLGEFCLALHSNQASKRRVVDHLAETLDLGRQAEPSLWESRAQDLAALRAELNRWVDAMHRPRASGFSAFDATARLIELQRLEAPRVGLGLALAAPTDDDPVAGLDRATHKAMGEAVGRLAAAGRAVGPDPSRHPFRVVRRHEFEPALVDLVRGALQRTRAAIAPVQHAREPLRAPLRLDPVADPDVLAADARLLETLRDARSAPAVLTTEPDFDARRARIADALARVEARDAARHTMAEEWTDAAATLTADEAEQLAARFRRYERSNWLVRWFALGKARRRVGDLRRDGACPAPAAAATALAEITTWRAAERAVEEIAPEAARVLGPLWANAHPDRARVAAALATTEALRARAFSTTADPAEAQDRLAAWAALVEHADEMLGENAAIGRGIRELLHALSEFGRERDELRDLLRIEGDETVGGPGAEASPRSDTSHTTSLPGSEPAGDDDPTPWLDALERRLASWLDELPRLRDWCHYVRAGRGAEDLGLLALVTAHATGEIATEDLERSFERSLLEEWLVALTGGDPALRAFHGLDHAHKIERFRALDLELLDLCAAVVRARLAARLPDRLRDREAPDTSEVGILLRESKKKRRHLPVRRLFERIPHLLPRLAPCMLMSPLSVAQYLDPNGAPFDLVVFDEASQVRFWDAMGAIGRARNLVVVGDSKQLPPTDFFTAVESGDGEDQTFGGDVDDGSDFEDLESLLDECVAAGLPRLDLRWHYRSRHESLITFSNHHYYDNRLLTFPGADAEHPHLGVRFVHVADGVYDRGRSQTNGVEARRVADEVVRRLRDPGERRRSLGIVTFSMAQQNLVQDLLDLARREHPEIESWFTDAVEEPVFVKNLENVQGDERDVILFSVGYGPDAQGRVHMNFGPLNRSGGERRLNVAVTRAREQLVVFSSIRPERIDLTRTGSTGAAHLKAFLDYADRGVRALAEAVTPGHGGAFDSPFEREVFDALSARGHIVHRQVGASGYRIDLGVVDPDEPGRYLLGIECDGATYHRAATARDRDRLRAAVLSRLGWRLHRVWSTDWWQNARGEIERLDAAIAEAKASTPARESAEADASGVDEAVLSGEGGTGGGPFAAAPASRGERRAGGSGGAGVERGGREANDASAAGDAEPLADSVREPEPDATTAPRPHATRDPAPAHFPDLRDGAPLGDADAFQDEAATETVRRALLDVLAEEAPVLRERALRRVVARYDISRVTARVRTRFDEVLDGLLAERAVVADPHEPDALWRPDQEPETDRSWRPAPEDGASPRDFADVPLSELAACAEHIVFQFVAMPVDDLARAVARAFGVQRLGTAVRARIDAALARAAERGGLDLAGGTVRTP